MAKARAGGSGPAQFRVFVVLVLYEMQALESPAFRTLISARGALNRPQSVQVYLFDNSPEPIPPGALPHGVRYERSAQNVGLAIAYNRALNVAREEGYAWFLTLDQDTVLPFDFLVRLESCVLEFGTDPQLGAIVPHLTDNGRPISPFAVKLFRDSYAPAMFTGILAGEIRALNSGSLYRVSALLEIGGYDSSFWLDYLDACVFRKLFLHKKKVFVAGQLHIEHTLSLLHRADLKPARFRNFLQAESAFYDIYYGRFRGLLLTARLACRICKQLMRSDHKEIPRSTWNMLQKRITSSRASRLRHWNLESEGRRRAWEISQGGNA